MSRNLVMIERGAARTLETVLIATVERAGTGPRPRSAAGLRDAGA